MSGYHFFLISGYLDTLDTYLWHSKLFIFIFVMLWENKKNKLKGFLQRILQEIMKKDDTWNIRRLVNETIVPATQRIILKILNNRVQKTKPQRNSKKTTNQKLNQPKLLFLLSATKFHLQRHVPKVARALSKILSHVDDLNSIGDYLKILGKIHHQNGIKVRKSKGTGILGWSTSPFLMAAPI